MTEQELQWLMLGIGIGMQIMLLVQIVFVVLDDRRALKVLRTAEAKLETARERAST